MLFHMVVSMSDELIVIKIRREGANRRIHLPLNTRSLSSCEILFFPSSDLDLGKIESSYSLLLQRLGVSLIYETNLTVRLSRCRFSLSSSSRTMNPLFLGKTFHKNFNRMNRSMEFCYICCSHAQLPVMYDGQHNHSCSGRALGLCHGNVGDRSNFWASKCVASSGLSTWPPTIILDLFTVWPPFSWAVTPLPTGKTYSRKVCCDFSPCSRKDDYLIHLVPLKRLQIRHGTVGASNSSWDTKSSQESISLTALMVSTQVCTIESNSQFYYSGRSFQHTLSTLTSSGIALYPNLKLSYSLVLTIRAFSLLDISFVEKSFQISFCRGQKRSFHPSFYSEKRTFPLNSLSMRGVILPVSKPKKTVNFLTVLLSSVMVFTGPVDAT
ncbi:unnamed protein product [Cochlearia groenlandica]